MIMLMFIDAALEWASSWMNPRRRKGMFFASYKPDRIVAALNRLGTGSPALFTDFLLIKFDGLGIIDPINVTATSHLNRMLILPHRHCYLPSDAPARSRQVDLAAPSWFPVP